MKTSTGDGFQSRISAALTVGGYADPLYAARIAWQNQKLSVLLRGAAVAAQQPAEVDAKSTGLSWADCFTSLSEWPCGRWRLRRVLVPTAPGADGQPLDPNKLDQDEGRKRGGRA